MTEVESTGSELAIPEEDMIGLEDFDPTTDAVMPAIRIKHKEAVFEDALSGQEIAELDVILLGLIKQRVLWPPEVEDNKKPPLCRSFNFTVGRPDIERFPWKSSGFEQQDNDPEIELPCESCKLKEWGSHPKRDTPWCSEQHTFALLQPIGENEGWAPALFQVQRSAIKPSRTYLTAFARSKTPLYTVRTKVTLDARKRGTVEFAVPKFIRGEATSQEEWRFYAQQYRMIREFVQTPRTFDDASEEEGATGEAGDPAVGDPAADDGDLPF